MEGKHTSTPWHRNIKPATKYNAIWSGRNTHVARVVVDDLPPEEVEANIEFIVRACNAHDDLVNVAKHLIESARMVVDDYSGATLEDCTGTLVADARAALAKAGAA